MTHSVSAPLRRWRRGWRARAGGGGKAKARRPCVLHVVIAFHVSSAFPHLPARGLRQQRSTPSNEFPPDAPFVMEWRRDRAYCGLNPSLVVLPSQT